MSNDNSVAWSDALCQRYCVLNMCTHKMCCVVYVLNKMNIISLCTHVLFDVWGFYFCFEQKSKYLCIKLIFLSQCCCILLNQKVVLKVQEWSHVMARRWQSRTNDGSFMQIHTEQSKKKKWFCEWIYSESSWQLPELTVYDHATNYVRKCKYLYNLKTM